MRSPKIQLVQETARIARELRQPQHRFAVRTRPWQIQPFMIAPVLPGETMKNLKYQAYVVSDPLKSKLTGWWHETYFFYVKHRDLDARDDIVQMHLEGSALTAYKSAANVIEDYSFKNGVNWITMALKRIVEEYFRDEGEAWNTNLIGTQPAASISTDSPMDSIVDNTVSPGSQSSADLLEEGFDGTVIAAYQTQWDRMRQMRLTNLTFHDWLEAQGVKGVKTNEAESAYRPELLRYDREWNYPTNTVEPTTGVPSTAAVFQPRGSADKDRFFPEPGFIIGVQVTRPKVYFSKQVGFAAGALDEARLWLPASLRDEAYTSIKQFVTGAAPDGPLGPNPTNGYWLDMRDLFIYGDQFVNFALTATDAGLVALPTAALVRRYASGTDADGLFVAAAPANQIRTDGVVSLKILGTVGKDQT